MNSLLRFIFLSYFITHIPITLCVDLQALFGHYYPQNLKDLMSWYINTYHDELMTNPPAWFKSFIFAEFLFQMPFFFVATHGLLFKKNWIRIPSIIYGTHVATTVLPILVTILTSKTNTNEEIRMLFLFYFPYFFIPFLLAWYMAFNPKPFEEKRKRN